MNIPTAGTSGSYLSSVLERRSSLGLATLTANQLEMDGIVAASSSFFDKREGESSLGFFCDRTNKVASFVSVLSLLSTFISPLRSFSAAGIRILSAPRVSALLLFTGSYALYKQAPHTVSALASLLHHDRSLNTQTFNDVLEVGSFGLGLLGTLVGLGSFAAAGKSYVTWKPRFQNEGVIPSTAHDMACLRADAVRRAFHDPEIWMQFSRQKVGLLPYQRKMIFYTGQWTNRFLLGGGAFLGMSHLALGSFTIHEQRGEGGHVSLLEYFSLGMQVMLETGPAMTLLLYRGARGSHRYGVGAPMSQALSEQVYKDPLLRTTVLERLRKAFAPLTHHQERAFILQAENDLRKCEQMLEKAEHLTAPAFHVLQKPGKVSQTANLPSLNRGTLTLGLEDYSAWHVSDFREAFAQKRFSPSQLFDEILNHPATENGSLFPRSLEEGLLKRRLRNLVRESDRRFQTGNARPLEGIPIAVKDLFPGVDGVMQVGSKTARITTQGTSPVVDILLEMGAIPIPVGMVAAANGGSGEHAGFGYIPHPNRAEFDPAGSSSATAHIVGLKNLPIQIGIGTDTGGSVIAPAGAVGVFGFVAPQGVISTRNMVPFATFLDRVGVLSLHPQDGMDLAYALTRRVGDDPHMLNENPGRLYSPPPEAPKVYFLLDVFRAASHHAQEHFVQRMNELHAQGYHVCALNSEWNFLSEVPMMLYPFDAYPAAAFTHTNPQQRNFFDPPRMTLDQNMYVRMPKAGISIENGYFDRARQISGRYEEIISRLIPEGNILASPSTEAIAGQDIIQGRAGKQLDGHDLITMPKNRKRTWGQISVPAFPHAEVGVAYSGALSDLMRVLQDSQSIH